MSKPAISVIIPAYNAQEYLRECLDSVLAQSFSDFEAIVVNDGSTDDTLKIAEEYARKDPRIKIITTLNSGLSCARNNGIANSSGEWISFIDSDDCLKEEALHNLIFAANGTCCKMVVGQWVRQSVERISTTHKTQRTRIISNIEFMSEVLYQTNSNSSVCAKLFHHSLFVTEKFLPRTWYEDLDIIYRIALIPKHICLIPEIVYFYRDNPRSFVNTFSTSRLDVLAVTERLEQFMRINYPQLLPAAQDRRLSANFNMFALMGLADKGKYQDEMQKCWSLIKRYRMSSLFSRKTRLKNKMGALASLLGQRAFLVFARFVYN